MKHKYMTILVICFLLLAGTGEWLYRVGYGVRAEEPPPMAARQLSLEEAIPSQALQRTDEESMLPASQQAAQLLLSDLQAKSFGAAISQPYANRLPEVIPSHPVIDHFRTLYTRFAARHVKPGWLHLVDREEHPDVEPSRATSEYEGITIPPTFIFETWYRLNASNLVVEGVSLMRDENGQIIQVSVYRDWVWHNLTLKEDMSVDSAPNVRLDARFLTQLETVWSNGGQIAETETMINGQRVIRFSVEEQFDPPEVIHSLAMPVKRARKHAYVDPDSGAILVLETIFTNLNGEDLVTLRTTLLTIENTNPPEEILAYLDEIQ